MTLHARGLAPSHTRPLKLGFLTPHNVHDPKSFSGTAYHAARALAGADGINLSLLGCHRPPHFGDRVTRKFRRNREAALRLGDTAEMDAVVGLVATELLDRLPANVPFLHVTDATPGFLRDVYGWDVPESAGAMEARVARRAAACIYSSRWMATHAQSELGLTRTEVLAFGVNLDQQPRQTLKKPPLQPLELLFVGADWQRKGGEIALATLTRLHAMDVPANLTCVGRIPDHVRRTPGVTVAGFLDKTRPRHARRLAALYARAHLLVLPTRGDCTPMVIAEAMAHGTPVLATETGGIAEMIDSGAGRTLPMTAGPGEWAHAIAGMTRDPDHYLWLSDTARDLACTRFSWDAWASGIVQIAKDRLRRGVRAA